MTGTNAAEAATEVVAPKPGALPTPDPSDEHKAATDTAETTTADTAEDSDEGEARQEDAAQREARRVQKRINKLTSEKYRLKAELDHARSLLGNQGERRQGPADDKPLRMEDFPDHDSYLTEKATREAIKRLRAESQAERHQSQLAELRSRFVKQIEDSADDTGFTLDDMQEVPATPAMAEAIFESRNGVRVAKYLHENPEEAQRIASIASPLAQAREIGRIEAIVAQPKPPRKLTTAPAPLQPLRGSSGPVAKDPEKMSTEEWMKWRQKTLA